MFRFVFQSFSSRIVLKFFSSNFNHSSPPPPTSCFEKQEILYVNPNIDAVVLRELDSAEYPVLLESPTGFYFFSFFSFLSFFLSFSFFFFLFLSFSFFFFLSIFHSSS